MKKMIITFCILIIVSVTFVSCATIISGSRQDVSLTCSPDEARVAVFDSKNNVVFSGSTPVSANLKRGKRYRVDFTKEGFEKRTMTTGIGLNPWVFGNIFWWPLAVVDLTGAAFTVTPSRVSASLTRDPNYQQPQQQQIIVVQQQPAEPQQTSTRQSSSGTSGLVAAVEDATEQLMNSIRRGQRIAIINVESRDINMADFVAGELETILVNNRFPVVDRSELDKIRREQNLQLGGEIDMNTMVNVGKFAGAEIIITGSITGTGELRRLRLRAISTESAEVLSSPSVGF